MRKPDNGISISDSDNGASKNIISILHLHMLANQKTTDKRRNDLEIKFQPSLWAENHATKASYFLY